MKKALTILSFSLFASVIAIAQPGVPVTTVNDPATNAQPEFSSVKGDEWKPSLRPDGIIDRVPHRNYVNPWQNIRESDVMFKKRVWREIDTRQKENYPFRYPGDEMTGGGAFIEILLNAVKKGDVTAFATTDDRFTSPLSVEDVTKQLAGKTDSITVINPVTGQEEIRVSHRDINIDDFNKYRLKEDWVFDRNVGRMVVRIIGIAPLLDKKDENGVYRYTAPTFWIYYPDLRKVLAKYEVYNPQNDMARVTWDDFFEKRMFSSYIIKSNINNPNDDDIKAYKSGLDRLYESEKIKDKLFNKEQDMWVN